MFGWSWKGSLHHGSSASLQRNHTFIPHASPLPMAVWGMNSNVKHKPNNKKQKIFTNFSSCFLVSLSVVTSYVPDDGFSALLHLFFFHTFIDLMPPLSCFPLHCWRYLQYLTPPASIVIKDFLLWNVLKLLIHQMKTSSLSQPGSSFCMLKSGLNNQCHCAAVLYMMYILYCSIHCNFYRWAIKQSMMYISSLI